MKSPKNPPANAPIELTRPFSKLNKSNADLAGGKGASLGEMTQAGIPVPPGFVVLSASFEQFIRETLLVEEIDAILDNVNHKEISTVEAASEKIKSLILSREMPRDIEHDIKKNFATLGARYVAVRSSATAEDGMEHAWAGQLESYLNTTEVDLLEKVKHCWASLFTPRAIFYRFEKGLHSTKISVAVVVQKMVESEVSGIAFSVHPVTEDYNQLIIEAGFGLGEAIVSGQVTPNSYVVEKIPWGILDINVSTQDRGLYKVDGGGSEWVTIPEPKASSQVLDREQILELAKIIIKIENHYGFPCDIEWAYEAGKFYIVQSRPITTLSVKKNDKNAVNASGCVNRVIDIRQLQSKIDNIANRYGLSLIVLFGSQATGAIHSKSDINIAILSDRKFFDKSSLANEFSSILKRCDIEIVDLNDASPTLMYCVVKDGIAWYEKNTGNFLKWKFTAIEIWLDTEWLRGFRDRELVESSRPV